MLGIFPGHYEFDPQLLWQKNKALSNNTRENPWLLYLFHHLWHKQPTELSSETQVLQIISHYSGPFPRWLVCPERLDVILFIWNDFFFFWDEWELTHFHLEGCAPGFALKEAKNNLEIACWVLCAIKGYLHCTIFVYDCRMWYFVAHTACFMEKSYTISTI